LRVVDLDVKAERRLEAGGEQLELDLLGLGEMADAWQAGLEALLEVEGGACALAGGQLAEGIRPDWRAEAEVEQLGEAPPLRCALVALHLDGCTRAAPHLEVVGGHPHLFLLHNVLLIEIRLPTIDEDEGVGFPIELGEVQLLKARQPVGVTPARAWRRPGGLEEAP
jgi:hypothetical protein